jgi:hypothetical protein
VLYIKEGVEVQGTNQAHPEIFPQNLHISTGLSFAKKGLGHLLHLFVTFVTCSLFCCLVRKLLKICLLNIHRDFLLHTTVQHLLLLVGIDTLIYRKYYDTPPILVGHQLCSGSHQGQKGRQGYRGHGPGLIGAPSRESGRGQHSCLASHHSCGTRRLPCHGDQ